MKLSKMVANAISKIAFVAVREAAGAASWSGTCQPKEPKNLKEMLKRK